MVLMGAPNDSSFARPVVTEVFHSLEGVRLSVTCYGLALGFRV